MSFEVTCTGMAIGTLPDPCVFVIFGASGDLVRHTLIPSLYALNCWGSAAADALLRQDGRAWFVL